MALDSLCSDWTFQLQALENTRQKMAEMNYKPPQAMNNCYRELAEEIAGLTFPRTPPPSPQSPLAQRVYGDRSKGKGKTKNKQPPRTPPNTPKKKAAKWR